MRKFCYTLLLTLLALRVAAEPRRITGQVLTSDSRPLAYAVVSVDDHMIAAVTDREGRYALTLPGAGEYTLTATFMGYRTDRRTVRDSESVPVDFRLTEDMTSIGTIVVTGTRTPKLLKNSPIVTRVLTSDDIRKADATNIRDLLQSELPGVEFSFSMDQQVALDMQGFGGTSVLFLVDGERLAGETLDNVDYTRLNMDNVERIEIVKGAASSLYGSNAVGGVVNIITRGASEPWQVNANTRWGAHNDQRHGLSVGFRAGRFNSMTDYQYTHIDNYSVNRESDFGGWVYGGRSHNLKERLVYEASERVKLTARAGYFFRQRDAQPMERDRYRDFQGGVRMDYTVSERDHMEMSYNFDQYDKSAFYPVKEKDIREYSNRQHSLRLLYNHRFGKNNFTFGGDALSDWLMSYQFENGGRHTMYSADLFAQLDCAVTDRLTLVSGLRLDYNSQDRDLHASPKFSALYKAADNCSIRAGYSGGFRTPTLKERYMVFDMASIFMIYGNPDLVSETSDNFSLSVEYARSRVNFTVNGYYNRVHDRISTVWDESLQGMLYTNTGLVDVAGADANVVAKFPSGFGMRASYAFTHEFMRDGQVRTSDTRPHSATLRVDYGRTWRNYGFNVGLSGRYLSRVETNTLTAESHYRDYVPVSYPGYTMWKLTLTQTVRRAIDVTLSVDNLFNYRPDYYSYNSPLSLGTTLSVGLSVRIEQLFKKNN